MANQDLRKEFESQLDSVSTFLENEIDKLKGKTNQHKHHTHTHARALSKQ